MHAPPDKPDLGVAGPEPGASPPDMFAPTDANKSLAASAVYDDVGGDTNAAFEKFKEQYPDDESDTDSSGYDGDGDQPYDVYQDGTVVKQRSTPGEGWDAPKDLCKCTVTFQVSTGTGESMEPLGDEATCEMAIDEKQSPYGFFDDVLKTMRKGEVADVHVAAGAEEGLPSDKASTVRVTLVDFELAPVGHEMKDDDAKRAHVAFLKDNGNGWFKKGDLPRAKRRYEAAVHFAEYETSVKDAVTPIYGNLAAVATLQKDWPSVIEKCDKVLLAEADNVKALYRKGAAQGQLKEYDSAIATLKQALALDATNKPAAKALRDVIKTKKAAKAADKKQYGDMFSKLSGFASSNRPKVEKMPNELDDDWDAYDAPKPKQAILHKAGLKRAFFDVTIGGAAAGRVVFELFDDTVPKTANNFLSLCAGDNAKKLTYEGCGFHRVIKGFMIQGGDFTRGDGTGGESIYGGKFDDEAFVDNHDEPGLLSMANAGQNTNGSQFFVTTVATPHLDGKHVVFGRVVSGMDVITKIEDAEVDESSAPVAACVIAKCGALPPADAEAAAAARVEGLAESACGAVAEACGDGAPKSC